MMRRLRGAVVGAGQMGRLHSRVVAELEQAELVAIVDPDPGAERVAELYGTRRLRSLDELLSTASPDFAIVTVPTAHHVWTALPLVDANVPILVEKPIAESIEKAVDLIEAVRDRGGLLAVGHVERFNPAVQALKQKLDEGVLGRIFQVHTRRLSPFPLRVGDTGVAMDLATHDLDLMAELGGDIVRIAAEIDRKAHRMHEDLIAALLRFRSGTIGLLEVNWLTPDKVRQLTVTGERGMFVVDYLNQHLTLHENAQATEAWETLALFEGVTEGNTTRFAVPRTEPLRAQLECFLAAVRGEQPVAVTGEDGLRAVRLALAVLDAGAAGAAIAVRPHDVEFARAVAS